MVYIKWQDESDRIGHNKWYKAKATARKKGMFKLEFRGFFVTEWFDLVRICAARSLLFLFVFWCAYALRLTSRKQDFKKAIACRFKREGGQSLADVKGREDNPLSI